MMKLTLTEEQVEQVVREAEDEQPTVTLTGESGNKYEYRSITSIKGGPLRPTIAGVWRYRGGCWHDDDSDPYYPVVESAARITELAREVWPDFDCEGAVPRLPKTVTVHVNETGTSYQYSEIYEIVPDVDGDGCWVHGNEWLRSHKHVDESPARVTELAREAFGEHWSCPGCDKPVVVMPWWGSDRSPIIVSHVYAIQPNATAHAMPGESRIDCRWLNSDGKWARNWRCCELREAAIIAACAAAGVPCCEEADVEPATEPPTVTLQHPVIGEYTFTRITSIEKHPDSDAYMMVAGRFRRASGEREWGLGLVAIFGSAVSIMDACAAAKVPCCEELGVAKLQERVAELEKSRNSFRDGFFEMRGWRNDAVTARDEARKRLAELEAERDNRTGIIMNLEYRLQKFLEGVAELEAERDRLECDSLEFQKRVAELEAELIAARQRVEELQVKLYAGESEMDTAAEYWKGKADEWVLLANDMAAQRDEAREQRDALQARLDERDKPEIADAKGETEDE